MMLFHCGSSALELPDPGEGACCIGAAVYGPQRCTCWKEKYDKRQRKPAPSEPDVRASQCEDCAYRQNSPERRGDPTYAGDQEELDRIVAEGEVFYCHQGIRRPVKLRHPSGVEIDGHPGAYDPPIIDGVPYRANGRPASICAGWAARRLRYLFEPRCSS